MTRPPDREGRELGRMNMRSTNPIFFIAFVLLAALLCIVLPIALTHGGIK